MVGEFYEIASGDDPKVVQYPDKVETGGVATCMAIGILNHKTRKGYLGHFFNWDTSSESLVDRVIREAKNTGDLEVALAGNIPQSREDVKSYGGNYEEVLESYRAHGRWTLQMVRSKGIRKIQNYLQDDSSEDSYEMIIDTEQSRIDVRKEEFNV